MNDPVLISMCDAIELKTTETKGKNEHLQLHTTHCAQSSKSSKPEIEEERILNMFLLQNSFTNSKQELVDFS